MSKCSRCQNDFTPLIKNNGLPYKTCDRCRCTDDKYRDKHEEQIKVYRDQYYSDNQDKIKEYREVNKDTKREQRKQYFENIKDIFFIGYPIVLPRESPSHLARG